MQKIKKGLQEKLNLINKIQNNLKIKKVEVKRQTDKDKNNIEFPNIQKNQKNMSKQCKNQSQINNPQLQKSSWINIKKITHDQNQTPFLNSSSSFNRQYIKHQKMMNSQLTTRIIGKNSPIKLLQFKTIVVGKHDKNYSTQMLRKTYLQRTSRIFSTEKKDKLKLFKGIVTQRDYTFYGKINQTNHIYGSKFKTLDPRFGGLTRQQLKQKIHNRQIVGSDTNSLNRPALSTSLNMYDIETLLREDLRHSSFERYNFLTQNRRIQKRRQKKKGSTKQRYSPWNHQSQQLVDWDQLPKLK